jgi:hypothetical protein
MITITDARNGHYNENGTILAEVQFSGNDSYLPYTAAAHDPTDHGQRLYDDLVAGKYGPVVPFTETPEMVVEAQSLKRTEINAWRDAQENGNYIFQYDGRNWDYGKSTQDRMSISLKIAKNGNLLPGRTGTTILCR